MIIASIKHKGLKQFFEAGVSRGLVGETQRIRRMFLLILAAQSIEELAAPPNYGLHPLTGDRKGTWSMVVTRNWRLTFELNANGEIMNMDLEDYHGA